MEDVLDMNSSGQKDRTSRKVIVEFCGFFFLLQFLLNNNNNNNNNKKNSLFFFCLFVSRNNNKGNCFVKSYLFTDNRRAAI